MNYVKAAIERIGGRREVDAIDAACDGRRLPRPAHPPGGFAEVTEILGGGVYVLASAGEIVFVGKASSSMLLKLSAERADRPKWLPRVTFDQVFIRRVHPDAIAGVMRDLIETYAPKHNRSERYEAPSSNPFFERRL